MVITFDYDAPTDYAYKDLCLNRFNSFLLPYLGFLWQGKKWRFWPKSAIFFPAIIKPTDSALRVSGGMGHDTLYVTFNMFNKNIQLFTGACAGFLKAICSNGPGAQPPEKNLTEFYAKQIGYQYRRFKAVDNTL